MSNATSISSGGYPGGTKIYRALLTQAGINAPVAKILTNTLGADPVWTRQEQAVYLATLANAFKPSKTFVQIGSCTAVSMESNPIIPRAQRLSNNVVKVVSYDVDLPGLGDDGGLNDTPIEIIVYP